MFLFVFRLVWVVFTGLFVVFELSVESTMY